MRMCVCMCMRLFSMCIRMLMRKCTCKCFLLEFVCVQARNQDFSWAGGGECVLEMKIQTSRGVRRHDPPGKF